jgi:hypothetical protein
MKLFGSLSKNDSNVQDYVAGAHAVEDGKETGDSKARMDSAADKLPPHIKKELDDRLERGTI